MKFTDFSKGWVFGSMAAYLVIEAILGGVIGGLFSGWLPHIFRMRLEILFMLASYFLGGFLVGLVSPRIRLIEPAVGAFLAVLVTFLYSFFTPVRFFGFSMGRLLIGGIIAFGLALVGAYFGEKSAARLGNRISQDFFDS